MEHSRILIVDDNPEIREIIHVLLEGEGFLIEEASDGETALKLTMEMDFDLIILDIMMPGKNGYQTCVSIRKNCNAPVLFLSARTKDSDKTLGFSSGGDDYLAKPFSYNELISRSKALIRRYLVYKGKDTPEPPEKVLRFHHLEIHEETREVLADGRPWCLRTQSMPSFFSLSPTGIRFSPRNIYMRPCGKSPIITEPTIQSWYISGISGKIEKDPRNPVLIKTIWGKGYRCD